MIWRCARVGEAKRRVHRNLRCSFSHDRSLIVIQGQDYVELLMTEYAISWEWGVDVGALASCFNNRWANLGIVLAAQQT